MTGNAMLVEEPPERELRGVSASREGSSGVGREDGEE